MDILVATGLIVLLFVALASGLWIGLALIAVGLVAMGLATSRPVVDSMALTIWGSTSSWTLTVLPLFLWMGEILFRTKLSEDMFKGLAPWLNRLPGRLLHVNVIGSTIFAAVSGSSAATCATIGRISLPELRLRGYPESRAVGPVVLLIGAVLGSVYSGVATATEAAAIGVLGSFVVAAAEGSLSWKRVIEGVGAASRVYSMIGLMLAGAAFLTLAMGFVGLPRHLAEFITAQHLSPFALVLALTVLYLVLGCFLDGISMVVLTIGVLLPTVQAAGFDLIWFGIFTVLLVELAQITPPVGLNLFVLQGLTKHDLTYVARTAMPMFFIMLLAAVLSYFGQALILWLPSRM